MIDMLLMDFPEFTSVTCNQVTGLGLYQADAVAPSEAEAERFLNQATNTFEVAGGAFLDIYGGWGGGCGEEVEMGGEGEENVGDGEVGRRGRKGMGGGGRGGDASGEGGGGIDRQGEGCGGCGINVTVPDTRNAGM